MTVEDRIDHAEGTREQPAFATSFRSDHTRAGASTPLRRVSVRVCTLQPGDKIFSPRDGTSVLVQVADTPFDAVVIGDSNQLKPNAMKHAADVCSLSRGVIAFTQRVSRGEVIRYDISRSSFLAFLKYRSIRGINAFEIAEVTSDPALRMLSRTIQPLLNSGLSPSQKFAEYFTLSLFSHLAERYGISHQKPSPSLGGLSPRNKRFVEESMRATLGASLSLEELSERCKLSPRHFARAFQQSFGIPFHRFQLDLRLLHAKKLLTESTASIRDIAAEMGHADQATFTESFTRTVGMPPGRYRRRYSLQTGSDSD